MWKVHIIMGQSIQKFTAETKKQALALIPWTKIQSGKGRIQRLEDHIYLVTVSS